MLLKEMTATVFSIYYYVFPTFLHTQDDPFSPIALTTPVYFYAINASKYTPF